MILDCHLIYMDKVKLTASRNRIFLRFTINVLSCFLNGEIIVAWKLSNCDTTMRGKRVGRPMRQKLICRAHESRDAARRVASRRISSRRVAF